MFIYKYLTELTLRFSSLTESQIKRFVIIFLNFHDVVIFNFLVECCYNCTCITIISGTFFSWFYRFVIVYFVILPFILKRVVAIIIGFGNLDLYKATSDSYILGES